MSEDRKAHNLLCANARHKALQELGRLYPEELARLVETERSKLGLPPVSGRRKRSVSA